MSLCLGMSVLFAIQLCIQKSNTIINQLLIFLSLLVVGIVIGLCSKSIPQDHKLMFVQVFSLFILMHLNQIFNVILKIAISIVMFSIVNFIFQGPQHYFSYLLSYFAQAVLIFLSYSGNELQL